MCIYKDMYIIIDRIFNVLQTKAHNKYTGKVTSLIFNKVHNITWCQKKASLSKANVMQNKTRNIHKQSIFKVVRNIVVHDRKWQICRQSFKHPLKPQK